MTPRRGSLCLIWVAALSLLACLPPVQGWLLQRQATNDNDPIGTNGGGEEESTSTLQETMEADLSDDLTAHERRIVDAFQQVSPSVVNVYSFFVERKGWFGLGQQEIWYRAGTASVWDEQGHIVTAYHNIYGDPDRGSKRSPYRVYVDTSPNSNVTGTEHAESHYNNILGGTNHPGKERGDNLVEATVVGTDAQYNIALLKLKDVKGSLPPPIAAQTGTCYMCNLQIGQTALILGHEQGRIGLASGVVSSKDRVVQSVPGYFLLHAHINQGVSGGPVLNTGGQLIGMILGIHEKSVATWVAISVDAVSDVVARILERAG